MRLWMTVLFSSILFLGACGNTESADPQDQTEIPGLETEENGMQAESGEGEETSESDTEENDSSSDAVSGGETNFNYDPIEVKEFELHIELLINEEQDYEFDRENGEAKIKIENGSDTEREGEDAFREIEELLAAIVIDNNQSLNEMIDEMLDYLEISRDDLEELDIEMEMAEGEKLGFKYHIAEGNESNTVHEFDMDIGFLSGDEWEYKYELNKQEFIIEYSDRDDLFDQEAQDRMESILSEVQIDLDQSIGSLKENFLAAIDVSSDELAEWDFEVEFEDEMKIAAKFEQS